jgi:hypothetical protein
MPGANPARLKRIIGLRKCRRGAIHPVVYVRIHVVSCSEIELHINATNGQIK